MAARRIDSFRGDFASLATLVQKSWAENNRQPLLYTPEFFKSSFEYPGATFSLAPTLYDGTNPLAFSAGLPRRIRFAGQDLNIIISSFLTVSPEYKKHGYGIVLWNELVKRARAHGFDGMVNYCIDGEPMNGMIVGCASGLKISIQRIFSVHYLSSLLKPSKPSEPDSDTENVNVQEFLEISAPLVDNLELARVWTESEAEWECRHRAGVVAAQFVAGARKGILTGYVMEIDRPDRAKCLLVEDVLWGPLTHDERVELLRRFLAKAAASGVRMATLPDLHYADMQPFITMGFRPSKRIVHGYLTIWNGNAATEPLSAMYLDVF